MLAGEWEPRHGETMHARSVILVYVDILQPHNHAYQKNLDQQQLASGS